MLLALVSMWGSSFGLTKIAVRAISAESVVAARMVVAGCLLVALVIATILAFMIGDRSSLFEPKTTYKGVFENVGGLRAGSPIRCRRYQLEP